MSSITGPSGVNTHTHPGFAKGTNEFYDSSRLSYQPNVLARIHAAMKPGPLNVVEVGAGTGLFTRSLLSHPSWSSSIRSLKAVEPSEGMREVFSKTIRDDRVSVSDGVFESTGIETGWADLVVIAQALHWAPDYDACMAENARVLKSGGVLACLWNLDDRESARWLAQARERIEMYNDAVPHARVGLWRAAFKTASYLEFFGSPEELDFPYRLSRTIAQVTNHLLSSSFVAIQPADEKVKIKKDIEDIIERGEDKVWVDESHRTFAYPLKTLLVLSRKK